MSGQLLLPGRSACFGDEQMDTELARTFLTVVSAGNFVKAAERLFLTQSAVSSRIQSLERQLGCRLFVRNKTGAKLTAEGRLFQKHAVTLMRTVESAQQAVGVPNGYKASLTVGGRFAIWQDLLLRWLVVMRKNDPLIAIRAEIGLEDELILGLIDGGIDIAVMYTPQSHPGLAVEELFVDELTLVSTRPTENLPDVNDDYILIDWGPEFMSRHAAHFPDITGPGIATNVGWLGIEYLLGHGGAGYFPRRLVKRHIDEGRLHQVSSAPRFRLPSYLVYPASPEPEAVDQALVHLRLLAGSEFPQH